MDFTFFIISATPDLVLTKLKLGVSLKWLQFFLKSKKDTDTWNLTVAPHPEVEEEMQPENREWQQMKKKVEDTADRIADDMEFKQILTDNPLEMFKHTREKFLVEKFLSQHKRDLIEVFFLFNE